MAWHVLAIDDDAAMCEQYRKTLGAKGFEVKVASSGFEALAQLELAPPDLVLLDVAMQQQAGWDTLRIMRATSEWEDIPVLVVTELGSLKSVSQGWELGCTRYLPKPFEEEYLEEAVGDLLCERRGIARILQQA